MLCLNKDVVGVALEAAAAEAEVQLVLCLDADLLLNPESNSIKTHGMLDNPTCRLALAHNLPWPLKAR